MKSFVYIIKSDLGYFYIGNTSNLQDRLSRHNSNRNTSTAGKGKWDFIITKECSSKSEAVRLETKLKKFKNSAKALEYLRTLV
jgi:putative endonuclease